MTELRQPVKAGNSLGNDVLVRRKQIVGQGFPVREMQHGQIRGEETQLMLEQLGDVAVGVKKQGKALCSAGSIVDGQDQGGPEQVAPEVLVSDTHTADLHTRMRISNEVS